MQRELDDRETAQLERSAGAVRCLSRRHLIGAAASGFVVGTHGLLLPAGAEDKDEPGRGHGPVRRVQDRADHRRDKRRTERARHRRQRRSRGAANKPNDAPRGCWWTILDVTVIFRAGTTATHTMTVSDRGIPRWRNQVVRPHEEFSFVGWRSEMELQLLNVSPFLYFRAVNPCQGYPYMDISKYDANGKPILPKPLNEKGFSVDEEARIEGFSIKRLEDADEHKVFLIQALD